MRLLLQLRLRCRRRRRLRALRRRLPWRGLCYYGSAPPPTPTLTPALALITAPTARTAAPLLLLSSSARHTTSGGGLRPRVVAAQLDLPTHACATSSDCATCATGVRVVCAACATFQATRPAQRSPTQSTAGQAGQLSAAGDTQEAPRAHRRCRGGGTAARRRKGAEGRQRQRGGCFGRVCSAACQRVGPLVTRHGSRQ